LGIAVSDKIPIEHISSHLKLHRVLEVIVRGATTAKGEQYRGKRYRPEKKKRTSALYVQYVHHAS